MRFVFFILIFLVVIPMSLFAGDPVDLGKIVVEDNKDKETPSLDTTSASSVIIPSKSPDTQNTIPSLLEQSAGVHVKRYGGLDDFSAIALRGSSSSQVQIYLDDLPLATSQGEIVDLSIIPMDIIDKVEVYRGGSPASVPDATAGGVIVIHTKKRPEKTNATFREMGGSFSTYKGYTNVSAPVGKFAYSASFERFQSSGDFTYRNNNGTTFNQNDDYLTKRKNNDFTINNLYTKFMLDAGWGTNISLTNILFNKSQGIPGLGTQQSLTARLGTWRDLVAISADKNFESVKDLSMHADMFFDFLNDQLQDPQGQLGLGIQNNDDNTFRFGTNFRTNYNLGTSQSLMGFISQRSEYYQPKNYAATPATGPTSSRQSINTGAEDDIFLFSDRLEIAPSLRFVTVFNHLSNDDPSTPVANPNTNTKNYYQLSEKLGVKFKIVDEFAFKGNFYHGYRDPTFSELFGDRGTIVGNPNLIPEESINFDAGFSYAYSREDVSHGFGVEAVYYRSSVDNLIQYMQTSQYTIQAQNLSKAIIQGMEFQSRYTWNDIINCYVTYTLQYAMDESNSTATNGKYLPGRPKNELSAGLSWNQNWLSWFTTKLFGDMHYISGNYMDSQNLTYIDNRTLIGVGLSSIFSKHLTASFMVKNLLNEHISDLVGYPLPGRSYWTTVELKI